MSVNPPPLLLRQTICEAKRRGIAAVIGADANAHHTIWGSTDINVRGESLLDFIINNDLQICNRGSEPTFVTSSRREVLDLTLTSAYNLKVSSWKVADEHSFSDHRYIAFEVTGKPTKFVPFRNFKNTNWDAYSRILASKLPECPAQVAVNSAELESNVDEFSAACISALNLSCPLKSHCRRSRPPWWSSTIQQLRSKSRKSFNKAKKSGLPTDWDAYKADLRAFKSEVRKSKRNSWRTFCEDIEGTQECSRFKRILSKNQHYCGLLKSDTGVWCDSMSDSLDLLVDTHFPDSDSGRDASSTQQLLDSFPDSDVSRNILERCNIEWAIKSFQPFKAPGVDGIIPAQLQNSLCVSCDWLKVIYEGCFKLNHIPRCWRVTKVVFIPKAGRSSHVLGKDFRPISLSSFLLKILERLLDFHIRNSIPRSKFSGSQHAYCKGRSVESALHVLVGNIEDAFRQKEFALGAFMDIEGAFNNVTTESILEALVDLEVDRQVIKLVSIILQDRLIQAEWGGFKVFKRVRRGTPQGGVLSPLLWLVVVNVLLRRLETAGCRVIAYADDIVIIVRGKFICSLSELMQYYLSIIATWATSCGLSVNPEKTQLVLFSRKYKIPIFRLPTLQGYTLSLAKEVKYLGLIVDSKLSWGPNTVNRVKKATTAFYCCRGAIGRNWGLSPKSILWIYQMVIEPILLYGVNVWWTALSKSVVRQRLDRVQRIALLGMSGALRTAPTLALNVLLHIPPLDLVGHKVAALSAVRLREQGIWRDAPSGHSTILRNLCDLPSNTDYCIPIVDLVKPFKTLIPSREDWRAVDVWQPSVLNFFADGSKLNDQVGGGVFCRELSLGINFRLPDHCSVFQAEIAAIKEVLDWLRINVVSSTQVNIYTDSQASIKCLASHTMRSKFASECLASLKVMAEFFTIQLIWVPGHCDVPGNCLADELARSGTTALLSDSRKRVGIPLASCRLLFSNWIEERFAERWSTVSTCKSTKTVWPRIDRKRSKELLGLSKPLISAVVGVITGHCLVGLHALRLKVREDTLCRSCMEEEIESPEHLLLQCPAHCRLRFRLLGSHLLYSWKDLSDTSLVRIGRFVLDSGAFN